jgi:hypothetical protein
VVRKRNDNFGKESMPALCLPLGPGYLFANGPDQNFAMTKMIQTPGLMVILYESPNSPHRTIFMDGRPLPVDPNPTWLGYSVGRWEGDTLVVESNNFHGVDPDNPRAVGLPDAFLGAGWLDHQGSPYTEAMQLTERFRRVNYGLLDIELTVDDPKAYTRRFTVNNSPSRLVVGQDLLEFGHLGLGRIVLLKLEHPLQVLKHRIQRTVLGIRRTTQLQTPCPLVLDCFL